MINRFLVVALTGLVAFACVGFSRADVLSIYEVQSNTIDGDQSIYSDQIHSVIDGIVTHIWFGTRPRVYLQDPNHPAWGGIVVKDWTVGAGFANDVAIGDRIDLSDVFVEESRGTTTLQYGGDMAPNAGYAQISTGNPVPDPLLLTAADLPVPVDHEASEPYESMLVTLENVIVGQLGLGKAEDNYELIQGDDVAWGTDYMNVDAGGPYDPHIVTGAELLSITGLVEQYTKPSVGWDYYQLDTRCAADIVPEPAAMFLLLTPLVLMRQRSR